MNPATGYAETAPRVSRIGVFSGLALGVAALAFSAPAVGPFSWPAEVEAMVSVVGWWVALVLVVWLALSLVLWLAVLGRPEVDVAGWVRLVTLPGSRKLAESLFAVSVLAGVAACAPGANEVVAPRIEVLRPAESATVSTTLVDTSELDSLELDDFDFSESVESSTTLAGIGSLDDARVVVDTATLDSDSVGTQDLPVAEPFSPGGHALAPSRFAVPAAPALAPVESELSEHVIVDGDNFWEIASNRVSAHLGRDASDAETTAYWVSLVKANVATIQSGNPDLVFPGEVIALPALP